MDIFENDHSITVLADMPGLKAEDLIDPREGVLTLIGRVIAAENPEEMNVAPRVRDWDGPFAPGQIWIAP